jgi:hypothetical protein
MLHFPLSNVFIVKKTIEGGIFVTKRFYAILVALMILASTVPLSTAQGAEEQRLITIKSGLEMSRQETNVL